MLQVENINPVNKGTLLATCSVKIVPWKLTLHEVKIFEQGAKRWIGMPAREFVAPDGSKKYQELITFDCDAAKNRFRSQIMEAVDTYLQANPDLKAEDVIKEDEDMPF